MNNCLLVLGLVAAASNARADSKADVEAIARKAIADDRAAFAPGAELVMKGERRQVGDVADSVFGGFGEVATIRTLKLQAVVDDTRGIAWFHGRVEATTTLTGGVHEGGTLENALRVTGLAVKGSAWKVAALGFSNPIEDDKLLQLTSGFKLPKTPVTSGDAALAKATTAWFTRGLAPSASKTAPVAIGTGDEYVQGAAATRLAGTWDKLKLAPYKIEAKLATKTAGFVRAVVAMPVPKKDPVPMVLVAVVVLEGDTWRWVALNWNYADGHIDVK